jgi:uncharacterized membrane protein YjjP (DUF1212 family)
MPTNILTASLLVEQGTNMSQRSVTFVEAYAAALQQAGTPAHRLEDAVDRVASALAVDVSCAATPTGLFLASPSGTRLLRVGAGEGDLGRLVALDGIGAAVGAGGMDAEAALAAVRAVERQASPWPLPAVLAAHAALAAGAAALFGGGAADLVLGGLLGAGAAVLVGHLGRLGPLLAAGLAALVGTLAATQLAVTPGVVGVAAIIVLLPGFSLTVGTAELANGHLTAGTARVAGAVVSFLMLGLGALLGARVAAALGAVAVPMGLGLAVLLRARPVDVPYVVAAAFLGWGSATSTGALLGADLAPFVGALVVALAGNAVARWRQRPASLLVAPGLIVLVPGSVGFRGVRALLDADTTVGIEAFVQAFLVAGGLVGGLLLAGVILAAHREL